MPGSGKSYNAVEQIVIPALKAKRKVVTNVPLHLDKLRALCPDGEVVEFPVAAVAQDPETIRNFVTAGCVFVLDEVWRLWPAGEKANKVPEPFKSLLAEHRHMVDEAGNSVSIVLLVQDLANIGSFARRLVEQTFIHTKLTHVGMSNRFRVDIFHGPVTGTIGPTSNRLREIFGSYKPEVYDCYKSHTMSEAKQDGANEKHIDKRGNILRRPGLIAAAIIAPLMVGFGVYKTLQFFRHPSGLINSSAVGGANSSATSPPMQPAFTTPQQSVRPAQTAAPSQWRVAGWILNSAHPELSKAIMAGTNGQRMTVAFQQCISPGDQPIRCQLEGFWYSETGRVWPAGGGVAAVLPAPANNAAISVPESTS